MEAVDDAWAVEAEVGGAEASSPDVTLYEKEMGNKPTDEKKMDPNDVNEATGRGDPSP